MSYRITKTEYHVEFFDGTHPTPFTATVEVAGGQATGVFDCHPPHCLWEDMLTLEKQLGLDIEWYIGFLHGKTVKWADYWENKW